MERFVFWEASKNDWVCSKCSKTIYDENCSCELQSKIESLQNQIEILFGIVGQILKDRSKEIKNDNT